MTIPRRRALRRDRSHERAARRADPDARSGTRSIEDVRAERDELHRYVRTQLGLH